MVKFRRKGREQEGRETRRGWIKDGRHGLEQNGKKRGGRPVSEWNIGIWESF